jgi:hypothetical protein
MAWQQHESGPGRWLQYPRLRCEAWCDIRLCYTLCLCSAACVSEAAQRLSNHNTSAQCRSAPRHPQLAKKLDRHIRCLEQPHSMIVTASAPCRKNLCMCAWLSHGNPHLAHFKAPQGIPTTCTACLPPWDGCLMLAPGHNPDNNMKLVLHASSPAAALSRHASNLVHWAAAAPLQSPAQPALPRCQHSPAQHTSEGTRQQRIAACRALVAIAFAAGTSPLACRAWLVCRDPQQPWPTPSLLQNVVYDKTPAPVPTCDILLQHATGLPLHAAGLVCASCCAVRGTPTREDAAPGQT